jgi:hypothetical protein
MIVQYDSLHHYPCISISSFFPDSRSTLLIPHTPTLNFAYGKVYQRTHRTHRPQPHDDVACRVRAVPQGSGGWDSHLPTHSREFPLSGVEPDERRAEGSRRDSSESLNRTQTERVTRRWRTAGCSMPYYHRAVASTMIVPITLWITCG